MYFLILFRYKDTIGKLYNVLITSVFRYYMNYFLFLIDDRPGKLYNAFVASAFIFY